LIDGSPLEAFLWGSHSFENADKPITSKCIKGIRYVLVLGNVQQTECFARATPIKTLQKLSNQKQKNLNGNLQSTRNI